MVKQKTRPLLLASQSIEATFRRPFLILCFIKYIASGIYLLIFGAAMIFSDPSVQVKLQIFAMKTLSGPLYCGFGLLHILSATEMLCPHRVRVQWRLSLRRVSDFTMSPTFNQFIQTLVTIVQILQAYKLSFCTVTWLAPTIYIFIVALSCLINPWLYYSSNTFVRQYLGMFIHSMFDFMLATGLYLIYVVPTVVYVSYTDPRATNSMQWITEYLMFLRRLLPNTALDLAEKCLLFAMSYVSSRRFVHKMFSIHSTQVSPSIMHLQVGQSSSYVNVLLSVKDSLAFHNQPRLLHFFLGYKLLLGLFAFCMTVQGFVRSPECPKGCELEISPWFESGCHCAFYFIRCDSSPVDFQAQLAPELIGTDLFYLHIAHCPLNNGFNISYLAPFKQLYGLAIEFSSMTTWELPPDTFWPESLIAIHIRYSQLGSIPPALRTLPPNFQTITLTGSLNITELPSDILSSWQNLTALVLNDNKLESIPEWVADMHLLERLVFSTNNIASLPQKALSKLPNLSLLEVANNHIVTYPVDLVKANPKLVIDLSNNPIISVPAQSKMVSVDGSLYCKRFDASGCQSVCSTSCSNREVGDFVCQMNCNRAECNFDGMDCANGISH